MFYAFDPLHLDGKVLTAEPLLKRRAQLARVLDGSDLFASQELPGTPAAIVEAVRGLGLEGVVAKRKDSLYEPGERNDAWQKLKLRTSRSSSSVATDQAAAASMRCSSATTMRPA